MRKLERTSEKKMLISIALEWDLRALHEVPHYHNLFVKASATHHFPAHYIQNEAGTFFFHPLCVPYLFALNTQMQQLLPGTPLKNTQHNRGLTCDEFAKKMG